MIVRLGRRSAALVATMVTWLLVAAAPAAAAPLASADVQPATGPLSWIDVKDSHGVPIWKYDLSLDHGGITNPGKFFWSAMTEMIWGLYRAIVSVALWFLDWVMSFSWLDVVASPLLATGDALQSVVDRIGAVPALLTVTAVVAVVWMARGRWSTGLYEIAASLVIAAVASGVLAQPVQMVAGHDGLIVETHRAGLQLSAAISTGDNAGKNTDELRKAQTARLADVFIVEPTQMVNFGKVLSAKCSKSYAEVVGEGPHSDVDAVRDKVKECDRVAGEYAANPSSGMFMSAGIFTPASVIIMVLALVLAGSVLAAGTYAIFEAVKMIVHLVTGLLPGSGRGPLLLTVAEAAISLVIVLMTTIFLGVFLLVIESMFAAGSQAGDSPIKTFFIVDVLLVVGLIVYWRWRSSLKASARRMADWMGQRPGASASRLPQEQHSSLPGHAGRLAHLGLAAANARALRDREPKVRPDPVAAKPSGAGGSPGSARRVDGEFVQPDHQPESADGRLEQHRRKQLLGRRGAGASAKAPTKAAGLSKIVGQATVVAATGGTGAVAAGAKTARAVKATGTASKQLGSTPRRAALASKLSSAAAKNRPSPATRPRVSSSLSQSQAGPGPASSPQRPVTRRQYDRVVRNGQVIFVPRPGSGDRS